MESLQKCSPICLFTLTITLTFIIFIEVVFMENYLNGQDVAGPTSIISTINKTSSMPIGSTSSENKINANIISQCARNQFRFENKILPKKITHFNRKIPRVIHLFAHSKCLPIEMAQYIDMWKSLTNHSVILHDKEEMIKYLSKERHDLFPFIPKALRCILTHEALLDVSRFIILYDQGGISVDIDHIPGPGFLNGTFMDYLELSGETIQYPDPWPFLLEDPSPNEDGNMPSPRFLASASKHGALFRPILLSVSGLYKQFINATCGLTYSDKRGEVYNIVDRFFGKDYNWPITMLHGDLKYIKGDEGRTFIGRINTARLKGELLTRIPLSAATVESSLHFRDFHDTKPCVDLTNDSYNVDMESLLEVLGLDSDNARCPGNLTRMKDVYIPENIQKKGRKIPNILHMTSKGKCFTTPYAENINLWKFEGYSFFLHDDDAVDRLLSKEWPEFPLLKYIKSCVFSGAQLADVWRYVAIWAYGGIYTDMDNAPGPWLWNETEKKMIIEDEDDAFFEVEWGRFPSQYFFAGTFHVAK